MANLGRLDRSVPSLSAGNIVSIAVQVTLDHWRAYTAKSLLTHLWLYLTLGGVALVLMIGFGMVMASGNAGAGVLLLMVIPLCIYGAAFGLARFTATGGLFSRLVYNVLAHQTESEAVSRRQIYSRTWAYLRATLWFSLVTFIVSIAFRAIDVVLGVVAAPLLNALQAATADTAAGPLMALITTLFALLRLLAELLATYYVTARLWFFDTILALKDGENARASVSRSWERTLNQGWHVTTVMFIGSLVTLPIGGLIILPAIILLISTVNFFSLEAGFWGNPQGFVFSIIGIFLMVILGSILMFPLWQAIKAVSYYDCATINAGLTFDLETVSPPPQRFMRRVSIQTPESLELDFPLGGIGSRAFAWVVDQMLLYLGLVFFWLLGTALYAYVLVPTVTETLGTGALEQLNLWALAIAGLLSYGISNGYYIGFESLWQGQTPGKRLAKIRVVKDNGQPVGLREASLRSLIGPLDVGVFMVGFLLITLSQSEKRLGDLAAGTLVIQDETLQVRQQVTTQMKFSQSATETAQSLLAQANVNALTGDQYLVLQMFLGYRSRLTPAIRSQVTAKLGAQLRRIITPSKQDLSINVTDRELLEAAYLACRNLST